MTRLMACLILVSLRKDRKRNNGIPRAVVPELDNVIANLELMPLRMNEGKSNKIGERQRDMAQKFYQAGVLSKEGLEGVLR